MRQHLFLIASVVLCQTQAIAAMSCADLFQRNVDRSVREQEFDVDRMLREYNGIQELRIRVETLKQLTSGQQERAETEIRRMIRSGVEQNIEQGMKREVIQDHEALSLRMVEAYAYIKLPEPRVLKLRATTKLTADEQSELDQLSQLRAKYLRTIGENFVTYRTVIERLEQYRDARSGVSGELFAKRASDELKYLGLPESTLRHAPGLRTYIASVGAESDLILKPSMQNFSDLVNARDPNLGSNELWIAKIASLDKQIQIQRKANLLRAIAQTIGDQAFIGAVRGIVKVVMGAVGAADGVDEALRQTAKDLGIGSVIASTQYGAVDHLKHDLTTTPQRYQYFRSMLGYYGRSNKKGIPQFMLTLALREDAISIYEDLKQYVRKNHKDPTINPIVGHDLDLLKAMTLAEAERAGGFLPPPVEPNQRVSYRVATAMTGVVVVGVLAYFLYDQINPKSDALQALDTVVQAASAQSAAADERQARANAELERLKEMDKDTLNKTLNAANH